MNDERRDELLLQIYGQNTEMRGFISRLQGHVEALNARVVDLSEKVTKFGERIQDHTGRIDLLETNGRENADWRAKVKGGWWVIGVLAAILAASAGLVVGLLK